MHLSAYNKPRDTVSPMYVIRRTCEMTHVPLAYHFLENLHNYGVLLVA